MSYVYSHLKIEPWVLRSGSGIPLTNRVLLLIASWDPLPCKYLQRQIGEICGAKKEEIHRALGALRRKNRITDHPDGGYCLVASPDQECSNDLYASLSHGQTIWTSPEEKDSLRATQGVKYLGVPIWQPIFSPLTGDPRFGWLADEKDKRFRDFWGWFPDRVAAVARDQDPTVRACLMILAIIPKLKDFDKTKAKMAVPVAWIKKTVRGIKLKLTAEQWDQWAGRVAEITGGDTRTVADALITKDEK